MKKNDFSHLLFIAASFCVFFLLGCSDNDQAIPTHFKFSIDKKTLSLDGDWKFKQGDLLEWSRSEFSDDSWRTLPIPGLWLDSNVNGIGIGWYRSWIDIPANIDSLQDWGLVLSSLFTAAEVYWDGELLLRHGKVAGSKEQEEASWRDHLYVIPQGVITPGRHLMAIRLSNHHWFSGAIFNPPVLGIYEFLYERQESIKIWFAFVVGLCFLSAIYHVILFLFHQARYEYLLFACVAFTVAILFSLYDLSDFVGTLKNNIWLWKKTEWIMFISIGLLQYWFLVKQFDFYNNWLNRIIVFGSVLFVLPVFIPMNPDVIGIFFKLRNDWFQFTSVVAAAIIIWAVYHKKPGANILLFGILAVAVTSIYALATYNPVPVQFGFVVLVISMAVGLSSKMATIQSEVHRTRDVFRLFVPDAVLDRIAKQGLESIKLGGAEEGVATILFTDIRSFTSIAEKLTPDKTLEFLNKFMRYMQPIISRNGGFINQFVGDEIMAIFYKTNHADAALETAIDMREALDKYNNERLQNNEQVIDMGIGVNTGKVIWGTIGSEVRMESAIIGDTVNLASRLQDLTKRYGINVLISDSAFKRIQNPDKFCFREIDVVQVKGKNESAVIYEVFDADIEPVKSQKKKCLSEYNQGMTYFRAEEWTKALAQFEACLAILENDRVFKMYIERCQERLKNPPDTDWPGVTVLHEK